VAFAPHFHPILVDRIVNVMYASDYDFDPAGRTIDLKPENFKFNNATFIPTEDVPSPAMTALADIQNYIFHLRMYVLAKELDYDALKTTAHAKLVELLVTRRGRLPYALQRRRRRYLCASWQRVTHLQRRRCSAAELCRRRCHRPRSQGLGLKALQHLHRVAAST
jgi:hypothetical protein